MSYFRQLYSFDDDGWAVGSFSTWQFRLWNCASALVLHSLVACVGSCIVSDFSPFCDFFRKKRFVELCLVTIMLSKYLSKPTFVDVVPGSWCWRLRYPRYLGTIDKMQSYTGALDVKKVLRKNAGVQMVSYERLCDGNVS